ncbi:hypothetical protein LTEGF4_15490 [Limnohabitans sp. TEGF004]|nr:hypothetical protein LTEGF4_15490 [Limnohabitans sp. TEGF004]
MLSMCIMACKRLLMVLKHIAWRCVKAFMFHWWCNGSTQLTQWVKAQKMQLVKPVIERWLRH